RLLLASRSTAVSPEPQWFLTVCRAVLRRAFGRQGIIGSCHKGWQGQAHYDVIWRVPDHQEKCAVILGRGARAIFWYGYLQHIEDHASFSESGRGLLFAR